MADTTQAAPSYSYELPRNKDALVANLKKRLEAAEKSRPDARARMNLAYMLGHQLIVWDDQRKRLERASPVLPNGTGVVQVQVNKIGPLVEQSVSRVTRASPTPGARPISREADDIAAAEVADRVLTHEFTRLDFQSLMAELGFWIEGAGWAYLGPYWDPDAGPQVAEASLQDLQGGDEEETGLLARMFERMGFGQEDAGAMSLYRGDVGLRIVPHYQLAVEPGQKVKDANWCIHSEAMTPERVWEQYNHKPKMGRGVRTLADELRELADVSGRGSGAESPDQVLVHTAWFKPGTRLAPQGLVVTWCGEDVIDGPHTWPYEHIRRLPFVQFDFFPGLGTPEGRTWVNDLVNLQKDYNDASTRVATLRRQISPKILTPRGSLDRRRWGSRFEVVDYRDVGQPPQLWMPDSRWMDPHLKTMELRTMEMDERAGMSGPSQGEAPSGMAAAAILALQEADETKLAIPAKLMADAVADTGWMVLMLVKQYWDEDRVVRTWSEDGELHAEQFSGADIAEQLDVHISPESMLSKSKSSHLAIAEFLLQNGLIDDPKAIMRVLSLPGLDAITEFLTEDQQQARRENERMMTEGVLINPAHWHNHPAHWDEHTHMMKSRRFEESAPEVQAALLTHLQYHEAFMQGIVPGPIGPSNEQAAQQQAMEGRGARPPGVEPTGDVGNPTEVAAGLRPPRSTQGGPAERIAASAGIGGAGRPGRVPGVDVVQQSARMGE